MTPVRYKDLIVMGVLFLCLVFLLLVALGYPFRAKVFPLLVMIMALGLLAVQIIKDIKNARYEGTTETDTAESAKDSVHKLYDALLWVAISLVGFLLLGHMVFFFLLPLAYSKLHRESWLVSISLSLGSGITFYLVFDYALSLNLYQGFLFSLLFP